LLVMQSSWNSDWLFPLRNSFRNNIFAENNQTCPSKMDNDNMKLGKQNHHNPNIPNDKTE
jgi:hypothetical protein